MFGPPTNGRRAFSLMELIVALAVTSILAGLMGAALTISARTIEPGSDSAEATGAAAAFLAELEAELRLARKITSVTPTSIEFTIPDRDDPAGAADETLLYRLVGADGGPGRITLSIDGSDPIAIVEGVHDLAFAATVRRVTPVDPETPVPDPSQWGTFATPLGTLPGVNYRGFADAVVASGALLIAVPTPAGTEVGDLLIAAIVTDGNTSILPVDLGWTKISLDTEDSKVTTGVWWKNAGAIDLGAHTFSWLGIEEAYGWIMRFSGHDPGEPIKAKVTDGGDSAAPRCGSLVTSSDGTIVLRVGGFDRGDITPGSTGIADHTGITMKRSSTSSNSCSGGAAFERLPAAGDCGNAFFALTGSRDWRTLTIEIVPD